MTIVPLVGAKTRERLGEALDPAGLAGIEDAVAAGAVAGQPTMASVPGTV